MGLMKNFMKALYKDSDGFWYHLCNKFPELSCAKVKEGLSIGLQIRKIIADTHFQDLLDDTERDAWVVFMSVIANFLGNYKSVDYMNYV